METHQFRNVCKTIVFYCQFGPHVVCSDFPAISQNAAAARTQAKRMLFVGFCGGAEHVPAVALVLALFQGATTEEKLGIL